MKTLRINKILISSIMMLLAIVMMASATSAWLVIEGTVGNKPIGSYKHADGADIKAAGENSNEPGNLEQSTLDADNNDHTSNAATPTSLGDQANNAATPTSLGDHTRNTATPANPGELIDNAKTPANLGELTDNAETSASHEILTEETIAG